MVAYLRGEYELTVVVFTRHVKIFFKTLNPCISDIDSVLIVSGSDSDQVTSYRSMKAQR
jgi:hypothetical protein